MEGPRRDRQAEEGQDERHRVIVKALLLAAGIVFAACQTTPAPTPQIIYVTPAPTPTALPTALPRIRPTLPPTTLECVAALERQLADILNPSAPPSMTQHDRDIMPSCDAEFGVSPSP